MKYPTVRIIFDRRKRASTSAPGTVEVEIMYQSKRKWISTGVRVLPKNWNDTHHVVGRADALDMNLRIEAVANPVTAIIRSLMMEGKAFDWEMLQDLKPCHDQKDNLGRFIERTLEENNTLSAQTKKNHRQLVSQLQRYGKLTDIRTITLQDIRDYDNWLHSQEYLQVTVASYHKILKAYLNEAVRRGKIALNPYMQFKIDRGQPGVRKYLTREELARIEDCELPSESFEKVRDLFVFQCYTGLAYADVSKFDFRNVIHRDGKHIIHDVRQKSGVDYYLVILKKAMAILDKYDCQLPLLTNQQYNMRLKIVAGAAGLDRNLTSHMARHTYASLCLNAGIKIEVLARMLGHTDIKTTQIYAKMLNKTVEDAFEELESKL